MAQPILHTRVEGFVTGIRDGNVIIVFETETDELEKEYPAAQFETVPTVGQHLVAELSVYALPPQRLPDLPPVRGETLKGPVEL